MGMRRQVWLAAHVKGPTPVRDGADQVVIALAPPRLRLRPMLRPDYAGDRERRPVCGSVMRAWTLILVSISFVGCTPRLEIGGHTADADEVGTADPDGDAGEDVGSGDETANDDGSDSSDPDGGDDCGSFMGCFDLPPPLETCDFWTQECPAGEKCTPVASTPGYWAYDATVCAPFGDDEIGEPCSLADGPLGADTCNAVSMCRDFDQAGVGTCVGFCLGPEVQQTCPPGASPQGRCRSVAMGLYNLCIDPCDPVAGDDCPQGQVCVAEFIATELEGFICYPPAAEAISGEECSCANCCAAQHMCVNAKDYGPDCAFDLCCTEYCDTEDTSFTCQGADQVCVGLFDPMTPVYGNIGRCIAQ